MTKRVYVTRDIPESGIELLKEHYEVDVNRGDIPLTKEQMLEVFPKYDGVLTALSDVIDKDVMDKAPQVKIFANYAVGFNNFDVETAKKKGIAMTNTPDVLSDTTAETAWSLLFAVSRRILEADRYVRAGKWERFGHKLLLGQDIYGKTLGIVGAGRIGQRMAEKARGYHMTILYHNQKRNLDFEKRFNAVYASKEELLAQSDFISLHCPLTEETRGMIDSKAFEIMKKSAVLVNTARGPVVDEQALVDALKNGKIWGAGLDVYTDEPNIHPELLELKNVVLLPHIGSATLETRESMSMMAAKDIIEVLEGRTPFHMVYEKED